jgi:glyoxylase-like metal-dependent hydrolase (beta-lactamase superfamily II)
MLAPMPRAIPLTGTVTWWPSTLYQTTTLELRRAGERLLVDPGISPWEIDEVVAASAMPVTQVLITHADWDHVMAIGSLTGVQITAGTAAAERVRSGAARESILREAGALYVPHRSVDRLRVDVTVDPPADVRVGPWRAACRPAPGHTDDGIAIWLPDEHVLVVGDYLSSLEIPACHGSVADYRDTLQALSAMVERERPQFVVVGHGRPHTTEQALRIAAEDLAYIEAVLAHAEAGRTAAEAGRIALPERLAGESDRAVHDANVGRACDAVAGLPAQG